jgi:hypothetical protein
MGKVIKNIAKYTAAVLSAAVVFAVILPLAATLIVSLPRIQNTLAQRFMESASRTLGTKVSIDRIDVKLINRVVVEGFYVEDFAGDTLLYSKKVTALITDFGTGGGVLTFGEVTLDDTQLWIKRDSLDNINIQEVVKALRGNREDSSESNFRMRINGIKAPNITFGLLREDVPFHGGIDFSRFVIRNVNADVEWLSIEKDTVAMAINSLSFDERSGFRMDNLSARKLVVGGGKVLLSDVKARAHASDLDIAHVNLEGRSWSSYQTFIDSVALGVHLRPSRVTTSLVGWFVPLVEGWNLTLDEVALQTSGPVALMRGEVTNARLLGTSFSLDFQSRDIPNLNNMWLNAKVGSLRTSASDINKIVQSVTGKPIPSTVMPILQRAGRGAFAGQFTGRLNDFAAQGTLSTAAGKLATKLSSRHNGTETEFDAWAETSNLNAGRILNAPLFGLTALDVAMKGSVGEGGKVDGDVKGTVHSLLFKGYEYGNVVLEGKLNGDMFDGKVRSNDPNMKFDLIGMVDLDGEVPHFNLDLDVEHSDLLATNLFVRDSVAMLSGKVTASGSGRTLDNFNGRIEARDLVYAATTDTLHTPLIRLIGRNKIDDKQIALFSDFVDARFQSHLNYRDMLSYLKDFLHDYIPLLYDNHPEEPTVVLEGGSSDVTDYSLLNVRVKDTDRLLNVFARGARIAPESELTFTFNPFIRTFVLRAHSDYLLYDDMVATDINLNSNNANEPLTLHLTSKDFIKGDLNLPDLELHGDALGRQMTLSTRFNNPQEDFSAHVGLLIDSDKDGLVRFRFNPSWLTLDNKRWVLDARSVVYDHKKIKVDGFRVYSQSEALPELTAHGVISNAQDDTLHVNLDRFDLSPLSRLTESAGYHTRGKATGYISLISVLKQTRMLSGIDFEDVTFNETAVAPMRFTSFWTGDRIRFQMLNQRTNENALRGTLVPQSGEIDAVAQLSNMDVSLLDPILPSAIENTVGRANAQLTMKGTFRDLRVNGEIEVPNFETTVSYTRVRYALKDGMLSVKDSRLNLPPTTLTDAMGNSGELSLGVDLSNIRNVSFEVGGTVRNLLAINTTPEDNESFYGQVFATGNLAIQGDQMGTHITISATTNRGSKFYMPLSAKSNISSANFVTFVKPEQPTNESSVLSIKNQLFERREEAIESKKTVNPIDVNMAIYLTPDAEFNMMIDPLLGNGINAHGQGLITMEINPSAGQFSMIGDVSITSGKFEFSMMDFFTRDFTITPGSTLTWTGVPTNASLDVEASYTVRTSLMPLLGEDVGTTRSVPIDCVLQLSGSISDPEITFDVKAPKLDIESVARIENAMNTQELKSMQFLSLLAMGSFVPDSSLGQAGTAGSMTNGGVGFDFLTNQLSNMLSNEDYNIYFRYTPQNEYTGTGNEFDVGFSKGFIDNRLILEIEGNYVDDRAANTTGTSNVSNLAGDVYLTWVIDKAGNLRLRVFTQTIDRLDENQGLQEGGIGIYYKKDFDSWRDIGRKNRDSFTNFETKDNN